MDADGARRRRLTTPGQRQYDLGNASFSPDWTKIFFSRYTRCSEESKRARCGTRLYVIGVDGAA
jgi:hypothetical protein